ncbi:membrane protein insertase YidC [Cytobacillus gottheilii]|uniref:membrane protein insertase YidC n=1 Tax=Cytobacillus gottheilii TaxID=859144 RepID=UPI0009BA6240|nr:membrane protein insertase YidC [Cytobacillus gottheilii]
MKLNKKILMLMMLIMTAALLAGCQSQGSDGGFFHSVFVNPFAVSIHYVGMFFNDNFGIAIIIITLAVRLLLMPLMMKQFKNQQVMKEKMDLLKPEMDQIQKKLKSTKNQKEQQKLQQEMMGLYQKHGVNPLNIGCLPMLIQMPILMGFYYAIRGSEEIATHSFLWFNLGQSDIWITALAGVVYFLQFKFSQASLPAAQQQQMKFMGLLSPIMIVFISLNAPAALPLYWTVGGIFLIFQSWLGRKLYQQRKETAGIVNTEV